MIFPLRGNWAPHQWSKWAPYKRTRLIPFFSILPLLSAHLPWDDHYEGACWMLSLNCELICFYAVESVVFYYNSPKRTEGTRT